MNNDAMLKEAFQLFDAANAQDPNTVEDHGEQQPKELVFAKRLSNAVNSLSANASESLKLAARCQHICRWKIPRNTEPMGRAGYLKWRAGLKKFHAETSAKILREVGYDDETVERVKSLNQKKNLKTDPECQTLEDALCLVFLEYQFDTLISETEHEKMIKIVQKTWAKMSTAGQEKALSLNFSEKAQSILNESLNE